MKVLKSVSEVKQAFDHVKTTKNVDICYKTALRMVDGYEDKKYIPYPVLYPTKEAKISEFFADLEKFGYNTTYVLKAGIVLFFNKTFVPPNSVLLPSRSPKAKNPPDDFKYNFIGEMSRKEPEKALKLMQTDKMDIEVQKAWAKEPAGKVGEFFAVSQALSKELSENAKVALADIAM